MEREAGGDRRTAAFVWGVWLAASLAALAYTAKYASDMPVWDEDQYVPVLVGDRPASVAWFLERHVDHLIPVPKAIYLATVGVLGDFRAGAFFSGVAMSAAVALLLVAVRRVRGRWSAADAALPLLSLNWGRVGNLLCSEQVQYTASVGLQAAALAIMLHREGAPSRRATIAFAACLVALAFCGGQGLALVPALALWPILARRGAEGRRWDLMAAGAVPFVLAVAMIVSHRPALETATGVRQTATATLQFLGQSVGPLGGFGWPGTRLAERWPPLVAIGVVLAAVASVALVAMAARANRADRSRSAAMLLQFAAMATLAVVVGYGRGATMESAGFQARYATLALPLLWFVHFAWSGWAPERARRVAMGATLAGSAGLCAFGCWVGTMQGGDRARTMSEVSAALRSAEPRDRVAARFTPFLHPDPAYLLWEFGALERARLGPFRAEANR